MAIKNQFKTIILLGLLTGILLWIGSFWGQSGLLIALIFSVIMNFAAYWFSDKIALAIYRARPVTEKDAPKLYRIVREISKMAKSIQEKSSARPTSFVETLCFKPFRTSTIFW